MTDRTFRRKAGAFARTLACCLVLAATTDATAAPYAYISNAGGGTVSVIDLETRTVTANIGVGTQPYGVALNPAGTRAYVSNIGNGKLSVIDTVANAVVATVDVGVAPYGVAVNPVSRRIYVANGGDNNLSVIDPDTNAVLTRVAIGNNPRGVAVNPAGTRVYVANFSGSSNSVSVVNADTNTVVSTITVGNGPVGIAVNPAGTRAYVVNVTSDNLSVIDTGSNTVVATVAVGDGPQGVAVSPNGSQVYISNFSAGTVTVLDAANNATLGTITVGTGPVGISFDATGAQAYVANSGNRTVSVLDTATRAVLATIPVGAAPTALGRFIGPAGLVTVPGSPTMRYAVPGDGYATIWFTPPTVDGGSPITGYGASCGERDGFSTKSPVVVSGLANGTAVRCTVSSRNALGEGAPSALSNLITPPAAAVGPYAYVTNRGSDTVSVIDTATNTVLTTVPVGANPAGVAFEPTSARVFITSSQANQVSVIDTVSNAVVATIPVGRQPIGIVVNPAGTRAYVANIDDDSISVINTGTLAVSNTIAVGSDAPRGLAINPAGTRLYVTNVNANNVSVIDTGTNAVVSTVAVGDGPIGIALNGTGSRAYVANSADDSLSVIDTGGNNVVATVDTGPGPFGVAVAANGTRVYVSNAGANTVTVLNTASNALVATVTVGGNPRGIAPDPTGARIYVANSSSSAVTVLDTSNNTVVTNIGVGSTPTAFGAFVGPATPIPVNQQGLSGTWYSAATSGQGFVLEVYPNQTGLGQGQVFGGWFTYASGAPGGVDRQRWLALQGAVDNTRGAASAVLYRVVGGNFDAPPAVGAQAVGTVSVRFASCTSATLDYALTDGSGLSGSIPLTRLTSNVSCTNTGTGGTTNQDFLRSGSWFEAATGGQGLVIEVNPVTKLLFAAWYTYAPDGQQIGGPASQRWYTLQAAYTPGTVDFPVVPIFETTGGSFAVPPGVEQATRQVGTASLRYTGCSALELNYAFTLGSNAGRTGTIPLVRTGPVPAGCQ